MFLVIIKNMFQNLKTNWNAFRIIRMILGLMVLIQGIVVLDATSITIGALFTGLTLFGSGCAAGNCYIPSNHSTKQKVEDIKFEEVVNKKYGN